MFAGVSSSSREIWKAVLNVDNLVVWGGWGSLKVNGKSLFDRKLTTCYSYSIETVSISHCFRGIASYLSKGADFYLPLLHLETRLQVIPFEFQDDLQHKKTRKLRLSCSVIRVRNIAFS